MPSIKYIWISLWNHGHRLDKNNIWLLPYCLSPILVPIIHPVHTIAALVTQLMLTVHSIMYLLLYFHIIAFSQHSPAIPYHTAYIYIYVCMYLDSLSSMTIHYTVPCRHCMLTYLDPWSCIHYSQASTLASPLIYNYPSHYSSGLSYDNLY